MAITRLNGANAISGTLPAANIDNTSISSVTSLPAGVGKIVQVVQSASTTADASVAPETNRSLPYQVSITPTSTSSKLMLHINIRYVNVGAYTGVTDGYFYDQTGTAKIGASNHYHYFGGTGHELQLEHQQWELTPPRTTSTTFEYKVTIYRASGSNTVSFNTINDSVRFTVIEYEEAQ